MESRYKILDIFNIPNNLKEIVNAYKHINKKTNKNILVNILKFV